MTKSNLHPQIFSLLLLFVFLTACNGQKKPSASENGQETSQSTTFPLKKNEQLDTSQISEYVVEIFEDSKSNLWFGTVSDGVVRYDGKTLIYFSTKNGLCDDTVTGIAEDKEGNMWFGTHNGIAKYDGKTFTTFAETTGRISGCKILIDRKGQIWAGSTEGAFRYNGSSFSRFKIPNPVIDNPSCKMVEGKIWGLMEDKNGNIWFGRDGLGACKYDGTTFTHFTQKDGLCSNNVSEIVEDKQGNIWFACLSSDLPKPIKSGGVCRYDGRTFTKYPQMEGLNKNDIYSIYADKKGKIWMGATGLGVYEYDGTSFKFFKGTDRMDLTWSMGIQSILEDSKGTLWFGFSGGLFRFNGTAIVNVPKGKIKSETKDESTSRWIDTKYEFTDSIGKSLIIQNSFPRGAGIEYPNSNGKRYPYTVFWNQITNETINPIELKIDFPLDSFEFPLSSGNFMKLLIPSDTMTLDNVNIFDYGLDVKSFLYTRINESHSLRRTIYPKESTAFYIVILSNHGVDGALRTELNLKGQNLFYKISRYSETKLIDEKEIHCGRINLKK
jgi:hypothetical protein